MESKSEGEAPVEKKVSCGKCGGEEFNAVVTKSPELVVVDFVCIKCNHRSRIGVKRFAHNPEEEDLEEPQGFFQNLKSRLASKPGEEEADWESDLDSLLGEGGV